MATGDIIFWVTATVFGAIYGGLATFFIMRYASRRKMTDIELIDEYYGELN